MPLQGANATFRGAGQRIAKLFKSVILALQDPKNVEYRDQLPIKELKDEDERFRLWAANLGVFASGHASLEYRLRDAPKIESWVQETLDELVDELNQIDAVLLGARLPYERVERLPESEDRPESPAFPTVGPGGYRDDTELGSNPSDTDALSDSSSDSSSSFNEVTVRFDSIRSRISSLYYLATKIRNPSLRPQRTTAHLYRSIRGTKQEVDAYIRECEAFETKIIEHVYMQERGRSQPWAGTAPDRISSTNDLYPEEKSLISRTGKANARRRQQFIYWREHADRLAGSSGTAQQLGEQEEPYETPDVDRGLAARDDPQVEPAPTLQKSKATSATQLDPNKFNFNDNRTVITRSSRISTARGANGEAMIWPSPPPNPDNSDFFLCPFCLTICPKKYLETDGWRTHLAKDLEPYMCTHEHCDQADRIYGSKSEWIRHESHAHDPIWRCFEHPSTELPSYSSFLSHIETHHPDNGDEIEQLAALCQEPASTTRRTCPFCRISFSSVHHMFNHLAFHLERFALLALPNDLDEESDSDSGDSGDSRTNEAAIRAKDGTASRAHDFDKDVPLKFVDDEELQPAVNLSSSPRGDVAKMEHEIAVTSHDSEAVGHGKSSTSVESWLTGVAPEQLESQSSQERGNMPAIAEEIEEWGDPGTSGVLVEKLTTAAKTGDTTTVSKLLASGANVDEFDAEEKTALMHAALEGNIKMVDLVLSNGADANCWSEQHQTALHCATDLHHIAVMTRLLEAGADVNATRENSLTPLALACRLSTDRGLRLLLEYGADPNVSGETRHSALRTAATLGREDLVRLLLRSGAKPQGLNNENGTALETACSNGQIGIISALLSSGAGVNAAGGLYGTPLIAAADEGHEQAVRLLLYNGAALEQQGERGGTALWNAARLGQTKIVEILLNAGANVDSTNDLGDTVLDVATSGGHEAVVELLREKGAVAGDSERDLRLERRLEELKRQFNLP